MGSRRDQALIAALVVIILFLAFVAGQQEEQGAADLRASTYLTGENGARALRLVLEELDFPTGQRLTPLADADTVPAALAILAPTAELSPAELHALAERVRRGGTLLYAARGGDPALDTLGLALAELAPRSMSPWERFSWRGTEAAPAPHAWTQGVGPMQGFRRAFADTSRALQGGRVTVLAAADTAPVVVLLPLGEGRVVAWSDALPLVNGSLQESGAALLFARAAGNATAGGAHRLWFDEFHHGYRGGGNVVGGTLRFLRRHPWGNAVLQAFVAALGLILLLGRRFGVPEPPPPARRRSPLEHVEALAGAYRLARARRTVRHLLLAGLARRMGRRLPPESRGEGELLERLTGSLAVGREAAQAVEDEWRRGDAADLVALTRAVDRLLEEVKRP